MSDGREQYSSSFKAMIVLEALRSSATDTSIAQSHGVHPVTLSRWKKQFERNAKKVFSEDADLREARDQNEELERRVEELEAQIDLLRDIFEHRVSIDDKVRLVNKYKEQFGLNRACEAVSLPKSTYYYRIDDQED